jgi:hypothetical protein
MTAAALACIASCGKEPPPGPSHAPPATSPVPPPDGLVAEVSARGPDALWGRLQQGVAGPLERLPQTVAGALATTAKLDLSIAGEVDGAAAAYGVVASSGASLGWVAALGLRDFDHARATLLEGKSPRFAGDDAGSGVVALSPNGSRDGGEPGFVLALSPLGYLLFASSRADLAALAPYATRTLPSRRKSPHGVTATITHGALAGPIHDRLEASLAALRAEATRLDASLRAEHGGKAPDLGDPTVVIQALDELAHEKLATLADLARVDVTLDAADADLDVELVAVPGAGPSKAAFAGLVTGDATPLLTLSSDTDAAILLRDDAESLRDWAARTEQRAAAIFKPALSEKDVKTMHAALGAWAEARGAWLTASLELEGAPALTLRTPASDPERATKAFGGLVDLTKIPLFRTMLETRLSVTGSSTATAEVAGSGATSITTFKMDDSHDHARHRQTDGHGAAELAVAWAATGQLLHAAAATSSARALRASKDPTSLLGRDMLLAGKLGTLRDRAAFVFAARRGAEEGARKASVVVALGRERESGWGMLEIDDELVREALTRGLEP